MFDREAELEESLGELEVLFDRALELLQAVYPHAEDEDLRMEIELLFDDAGASL